MRTLTRFLRRALRIGAVFIAAATAAVAGVDRWTPLGPDGGDTAFFSIDPSHPDTLYLVAGDSGRDAGLYRSLDSGTTWSYLHRSGYFTGEIIDAVVVDPRDSCTLYAHVRLTDIQRSTDCGQTWTLVLADAAYSFALDPLDSKTLYALTHDYSLQKSVDGGATWQLLAQGIVYNLPETSGGGSGWEILIAPTEPRTIYIGYSYQTLRSTDGGHTWGVVGPWDLQAYALGALDPQVLFARITYGGCGARSEDGGATFVMVLNPPGTYCGAFAFDPRAPRRLYAAAGSYKSQILLTEDDGVTWTDRSQGLPPQFIAAFIAVDPTDSNRLYLGTYEYGVFTSRNGGHSWQPASRGFTSRALGSVSVVGDPPVFFAIDHVLHRSADYGQTWTVIGSSPPEFVFYPMQIIEAHGHSGRLYAAEPYGLWTSTDRGETWSLLSDNGPQSLAFVTIDPRHPRTLYTGGGNGVSRSTDGGHTWATRNKGLVFPEPCDDNCSKPVATVLLVDPADSSKLHLIWNSQLYLSHDAAATWTLSHNGLPEGTSTIVRAAGSFGPLYAAAGCAGIFRSTDNANTWQPASAGIGTPEVPLCVNSVAPSPDNPSILAAATDGGGVFRTTDAGNTWTAIAEGLPARYISNVAWDPSTPTRLYATTEGAGLMTFRFADAPTITLGDRFQLAAAWRHKNQSGAALPAPFSARAATFSYFNPDHPDLAVKLLDGGGVNGHTWWFGGSLSQAEAEVTVLDSATGDSRTYVLPAGRATSIANVNAFGAPPGAPESSDETPPTAYELQLLGGRFEIAVEWYNESAVPVVAPAVALSDNAGAFVFFHQDNPEVVVKMIDGRGVNGKFWIFAGGLSSVEYAITVTDRDTGSVRRFGNAGELTSFGDTSAF